MSTEDEDNQTDLNYFYKEYKKTKNVEYAAKIVDMMIDNKIEIPKVIKKIDMEALAFYARSGCKSRCIVCGEWYYKGHPFVFVKGKKGWHEECASDEDKQFPYYQAIKSNALKANPDFANICEQTSGEGVVTKNPCCKNKNKILKTIKAGDINSAFLTKMKNGEN